MEDVGVASIPECVMIGGWIARAVDFPVILDGDTGHGGIMAVRRLVEDSIRAGLAGIRIDDQDIEAKRGTTNAGITVAPLEVVLARYRAAVDCARELDPDFVIMAQCYVGEAINGSFDEALRRMRLYREVADVDWVQFTAPRSLDDVRAAAPGRGRPVLGDGVSTCRRRSTTRTCCELASRSSGRRIRRTSPRKRRCTSWCATTWRVAPSPCAISASSIPTIRT